ncbi:hypothetical protein NDS46_29965 (plasmid) [Paenibacillus thiaminolyticus]|uniref:phosphoadenosine phosphosulfate reductase domain-containing protein n=1 Tax=Paenibacillus thiaminolyticus TaxID=49283 RepID=UPI00232FC8B9|nr:phosphoadenosine phosphosulfate reductase family protein [Paenibacillus thiaminolyticus]WCF11575.1 hypothetical protein NDS46_29965 [Paenibacillus thiaminolyticus]
MAKLKKQKAVEEEVLIQQEFGINRYGEWSVIKPPNNHIIFFSGGKASFAVADFVKRKYPEDNIVLYFNDVMWESEDLYRFINESSDKLKLPLLTHSIGLNPLQLMFEKKLVYNSRMGDCSKILKMQVASRFLKKGKLPKIEHWRNKEYLINNHFVKNATLYFGIGFDEMHRQDAIVYNWKPFKVSMPLIDHFINIDEVLASYSIRQPILYDLGFSHNNCNARCVKAGQGHYKNLKEKMPDVFKKIMEQEHHLKNCVSAYRYIKSIESDGRDGFTEDYRSQLYAELDYAYRDYFYDRAAKPRLYIHPAVSATAENMEFKQYSFMKKKKKPYPIRSLHFDVEQSLAEIDKYDIGGCGCFVGY